MKTTTATRRTLRTLRTIMSAAHRLTRETVKAYPGSNYGVTLAAALRLLWAAELKTPAPAPVEEAPASVTTRESWEALQTSPELFPRLESMLRRVVRWDTAGAPRKDGTVRPSMFSWTESDSDFPGGYISAAWEFTSRQLDYMESREERDSIPVPPLGSVLFWGCYRALYDCTRREHSHPVAIVSLEVETEDGNTVSLEAVDLDASPLATRGRSTETEALNRVYAAHVVERVCRDTIDRGILEAVKREEAPEQAAYRLGITYPAFRKRLQRIRDRAGILYI